VIHGVVDGYLESVFGDGDDEFSFVVEGGGFGWVGDGGG